MTSNRSWLFGGAFAYFVASVIYAATQPAVSSDIIAVRTIYAGAEELVFRSLLLGVLAKYIGNGRALIVSSLVFAAAHFNIGTLHVHLLGGLLFGSLYLFFRSVWPSIFVHAAHNLIFYSIQSEHWKPPAWWNTQPWLADFVAASAGLLYIALVCVLVVSLRRQHRL